MNDNTNNQKDDGNQTTLDKALLLAGIGLMMTPTLLPVAIVAVPLIATGGVLHILRKFRKA